MPVVDKEFSMALFTSLSGPQRSSNSTVSYELNLALIVNYMSESAGTCFTETAYLNLGVTVQSSQVSLDDAPSPALAEFHNFAFTRWIWPRGFGAAPFEPPLVPLIKT